MNVPFKYPGSELEMFQHAKNWKNYFSEIIIPYIKGNVLEVGAGIGATTILLNNTTSKEWLLLEPDQDMSKVLKQKIEERELPVNCKLLTGTINEVNSKFDTIIYIDVLEHIENDKKEITTASELLNEGGNLIVLSPAFEILFSSFDKAIGHFRRYNKKDMKELSILPLQLIFCSYFDSIGFFAALMNKFFLKQKYPTKKQVMFWDKLIVPVSTVTDKIFFHRFGKSIISIWAKK